MSERPAIDRRRTDDERTKVCQKIGRRIRCGPKAEARCRFCGSMPTRQEAHAQYLAVLERYMKKDLH